MRFTYILLTLAILLSVIGCTENNTTNVVGFDRTLVIITDHQPESETILGIMGAVKKSYPNVDIQLVRTHDFDIFGSGYLLELTSKVYPDNTCFAVLVDPGADSKKIAFQSGNKLVVAPDNGSTTKLRMTFPPSAIYNVDNLSIFKGDFSKIENIPSDIFYRDAILNLLSDKSVSSFGSVNANPVELTILNPFDIDNVITGQILFTDNFGNCTTNISKQFASKFQEGDLLEFHSGTNIFYAKYGVTYSSVAIDENVAFFNSKGTMDISVNYGNIADRYSLKSGDILSFSKAKIRAGILRFNSTELVDNIFKGMKAELTAKGFIEGKDIEYVVKNAQGDVSKFKALISELLNERVSIVIPISTPASQAALQYVPNGIPIVYTYVTSPEYAGLVNKRPNTTGLSDGTNFDDYLKFTKELMPSLEKAGRIYNPSESNSAFSQDKLITLGNFYGISYDNETVNSVSQITSAFNSLKSRNITTILIAADNTLNLGMKYLADNAKSNNVILIGDSEENVTDGALASISVDYDLMAKATGVTAGKVILGSSADNIPIHRFPTSVITLNQTTADAIGFTFTQEIKSKAHKIIK